MKIKAIIIILLLSYISVSSFAQQKETEVTYVGNAGFLIKIGDKKILIDALFKGFEGDYILPEHIQEKLSLAQAPFNDVDLVLVTHAHGDHISANMVQQHMKNNPNAIFASTKQTVDALNARDTIDNFHDRRIGFNPSKEKSDKQDIKGISIEAFYLPHGPDSRIINNGFLVTVNGVSFFHTGDVDYDQFTYEEFQSFKLPEKKIDLAFIQHFYLTSDSISQEFVTKGIGGKYILPIHYHFTTPSFDAAIVKGNYPDAILFDKELASWKMPSQEDDFTIQKGYYYDQALPGDSAVMFAPEKFSFSDRLESNITFSPDGNECYFGLLEIKDNKASYKIYQSKYVNNKWTEQTEAPFSINNNFGDPIFSADGKKLYLNKKGDIWMVERIIDGWEKPIKLPAPINSDASEGSISESSDGVAYISSRRPDGFGGIDNYRINRLKDQSLQAENLGPVMNSKYFDYSPFIAPDGSYFIFGSYRARRDGLLYISFNKGNNEWTTPINMNSCGAKVNNATAHHSNPSLSPDGKFLFFRRHANMMEMDVYWVSTNIIKKLKEKALQESTPQRLTHLKGDYLGQTPPGDLPVIFAPGIVSVNGRYEYGVSFTPDLKEIYFTAHEKGKSASVYFSKLVDKKWKSPKKANLTNGEKRDEMEAFVNLTGDKIYFTAYDSRDVKIWSAIRSGDWWNNAKVLDSPINDDIVFYSSEAKNGDLYYKNVSKGKMYYAPIKDGKFPKIHEAGIEYGSHGFMAPSLDFMVLDAKKDNNKTKDKDIHVCFRNEDGSWTKPINLGNTVNSDFNETCPSITPDGKYLFFSRYNEKGGIPNIYWVSTNMIKKLKENALPEASAQKFTDLKGDYLGQTPPGNIPEIFAPGIISAEKLEHSAAIFSPDGNTVYWSSRVNQRSRLDIWTMSRINNRWTEPETFKPLGDSANYFDPHISDDGNKIYFSAAMAGFDGLWYSDKKGNGWAKPQKFDHPLSETKNRNQLSIACNGNLYYLAHQTIDDKWTPSIVRSQYKNGTYQNTEALPSNINSSSLDWTPCIAPNDSYLLFASNRDERYTDLYISFHNIKNDTWSEAIKLPEPINTSTQETFPYISPDGKYLFFTRWTNQEKSMDIYWVSTKFIDDLKKEILSPSK